MKEEDVYINLGKSLHIFNEIELFINLIITHNIKPKDEEFFLNYILNNSVINFGGKIKILINLNIFNKIQIEKIRAYSSNRNVFAHTNKSDHVEINVDEEEPNSIEIIINDVILITNARGKITPENYSVFIKKHILLQNEIIDFISEYVITNNINTNHNHIGNLKLLK